MALPSESPALNPRSFAFSQGPFVAGRSLPLANDLE